MSNCYLRWISGLLSKGGMWYYGEGQAFSHTDIFEELGHHHEQLHTVAKDVIRLWNRGERTKAQTRYNDFLSAKDAMFRSLDVLYRS